MNAFQPKQKPPQQRPSSAATKQGETAHSIRHPEHPIPDWQRTNKYQAMPGLSQAGDGDAGPNGSHARFAYNFASIRVFPPPVRGIQRKLTVNAPGDTYEQEADRVAEQVMRMPEPGAAATPAVSGGVAGVQRECACGGTCDNCKKKHPEAEHAQVQMKAAGPGSAGGIEAPPIVHDVLRSSGQPLDAATRAFMEPRFGYDFSRVRVHTDAKAVESARAVGARAYTVGSNVVFGAGEHAPRTEAGQRLLGHELAHVVQQGDGVPASSVPRSITQQHDAVEQEAHTLAGRSRFTRAAITTVNKLGPVIARYPKEGEKLQQRESEALQHGQDPLAPVNAPPDFFQKLIKENLRQPPVRPGSWSQIRPGSRSQIEDAIPNVKTMDLFNQAAIQIRLRAIAEDAESREKAKPGGKVDHSANALMDYWKDRFVNSVDYILYRREDKRQKRLDQLHAKEMKLVDANPTDIIAQVEALRRDAQTEWLSVVQQAADQFVTLAANQALFVTTHQKAQPVQVAGLPESIEGTVQASDAPDVVAFDKDPRKTSSPVAPSVVKFMRAVQKEAKMKVVADNYPKHETENPWVGDKKNIGKYSFDVDLSGFIKVNRGSPDPTAEGFYDRKLLIDFFLAADRAAAATRIEWNAYYNDFEVARTVNEKLGKLHIGYSGGGGKGAYHHGPAPYVLHVHFNIMPIDLKENFDRAQALKPIFDRVVLPILEMFNPK